MLLLLLTTTATTTRLAVLLVATPLVATATVRLVTGDPVARCKLDFQLDNFIPLLVATITLGNRQQLTQTAPGIKLRRYRGLRLRRIFNRIFRIGWE